MDRSCCDPGRTQTVRRCACSARLILLDSLSGHASRLTIFCNARRLPLSFTSQFHSWCYRAVEEVCELIQRQFGEELRVCTERARRNRSRACVAGAVCVGFRSIVWKCVWTRRKLLRDGLLQEIQSLPSAGSEQSRDRRAVERRPAMPVRLRTESGRPDCVRGDAAIDHCPHKSPHIFSPRTSLESLAISDHDGFFAVWPAASLGLAGLIASRKITKIPKREEP